MSIREKLFELQDKEYKKFHSALMPTVDPEKIIGIRTPVLRKLAKEIKGTPEAEDFLNTLPHSFYEENNLHVFLLQSEKSFDRAIYEIEKFLPFIDNWATCDAPPPKAFEKNRERLLPYVEKWLKEKHTYTVRYGIGILMRLFLEEFFDEKYPVMVAEVKSEEYYVNMMRAWYFATAMAKQKESILPYLTENRLDVWTHNKTIQKCVESYRIDGETKAFLRNLKRQK